MEYKKQSHCVYRCDYHLVMTTKYRRKIFNSGVFAYFESKLQEVRKYYPEIEFLEVNHDIDHVHLLLSIPPKMSVGSVVRVIKANTSRGVKKKFPFLKDVYWGTDGIWSDGYFVSTVGLKQDVLRRYIQHQGKEDTGQAKLDLK